MPVCVYDCHDVEHWQQTVRTAAGHFNQKLVDVGGDPMEVLYKLKFERFGYDPLSDRRLNPGEQLDQTFHTMAQLAAARRLLECHPDSGGLRLNLTTDSGTDITSVTSDVVAAEVFATVHHDNNGDLRKNIKRVAGSNAANRYVFVYCCCSDCGVGRRCDLERRRLRNIEGGQGIKIWTLEREEVM